jgi:predicted esterase
MDSTCNMGFDFLITKYHDSVNKIASLIRKMAAKTGSFESIAVAGFSQGGQVAIDAALAS